MKSLISAILLLTPVLTIPTIYTSDHPILQSRQLNTTNTTRVPTWDIAVNTTFPADLTFSAYTDPNCSTDPLSYNGTFDSLSCNKTCLSNGIGKPSLALIVSVLPTTEYKADFI